MKNFNSAKKLYDQFNNTLIKLSHLFRNLELLAPETFRCHKSIAIICIHPLRLRWLSHNNRDETNR